EHGQASAKPARTIRAEVPETSPPPTPTIAQRQANRTAHGTASRVPPRRAAEASSPHPPQAPTGAPRPATHIACPRKQKRRELQASRSRQAPAAVAPAASILPARAATRSIAPRAAPARQTTASLGCRTKVRIPLPDERIRGSARGC